MGMKPGPKPSGLKKCIKCHRKKSLKNFELAIRIPVGSKDGYDHYCRDCRAGSNTKKLKNASKDKEVARDVEATRKQRGLAGFVSEIPTLESVEDDFSFDQIIQLPRESILSLAKIARDETASIDQRTKAAQAVAAHADKIERWAQVERVIALSRHQYAFLLKLLDGIQEHLQFLGQRGHRLEEVRVREFAFAMIKRDAIMKKICGISEHTLSEAPDLDEIESPVPYQHLIEAPISITAGIQAMDAEDEQRITPILEEEGE